LIKIFDENPSLALVEAKQRLCEHFVGHEISVSGFYNNTREKCALSLKLATKYILEHLVPRIIEVRLNIISQWEASGVSFQKTVCLLMRQVFTYN
jgi:hypothetical protein